MDGRPKVVTPAAALFMTAAAADGGTWTCLDLVEGLTSCAGLSKSSSCRSWSFLRQLLLLAALVGRLAPLIVGLLVLAWKGGQKSSRPQKRFSCSRSLLKKAVLESDLNY